MTSIFLCVCLNLHVVKYGCIHVLVLDTVKPPLRRVNVKSLWCVNSENNGRSTLYA